MVKTFNKSRVRCFSGWNVYLKSPEINYEKVSVHLFQRGRGEKLAYVCAHSN